MTQTNIIDQISQNRKNQKIWDHNNRQICTTCQCNTKWQHSSNHRRLKRARAEKRLLHTVLRLAKSTKSRLGPTPDQLKRTLVHWMALRHYLRWRRICGICSKLLFSEEDPAQSLQSKVLEQSSRDARWDPNGTWNYHRKLVDIGEALDK